VSVFLPPEWVKTVRDESGGNRPDEPPVRPDGPADKPAPAPAEAAGAAVPDDAPSPGSPERPSSVGTDAVPAKEGREEAPEGAGSVTRAVAGDDGGTAGAGDVGDRARRPPTSPWPWFVTRSERAGSPAAPDGPPPLPRRIPKPPPSTQATASPFVAPGAAARPAFPLIGRAAADAPVRPTFGARARTDPPSAAPDLPRRPSTTLPPVSDAPVEPSAGDPPRAGEVPLAGERRAPATGAEDEQPGDGATPTGGEAGVDNVAVEKSPAAGDGATPTGGEAGEPARTGGKIRFRRWSRRPDAEDEAEPARVNGHRPAAYDEPPTEVMGPLGVGLWDEVEDDGARSRRGTRRGRPDPDRSDAPPRRPAVTPAAVEEARDRASARAGAPPPRPTLGDRVRTAVRGIGQTLITLGLIVLLFVAYELWVTDWMNARTQNKLSDALQQDWERGDNPIVSAPDPRRPSQKVSRIPLGRGFANIYIPRFGVDYVFTVVEGTDPNELNDGPGHYVTSVLPGEIGNFAIAGHRVGKGSPFLNLDKLRANDAIVIETKDSWITYRVLGDVDSGDSTRPGRYGLPGRQIVDPSNVGVILPVPGRPGVRSTARLITLTTCHPKFSARQRLVIHGEQQGAPLPKSRGLPDALKGA